SRAPTSWPRSPERKATRRCARARSPRCRRPACWWQRRMPPPPNSRPRCPCARSHRMPQGEPIPKRLVVAVGGNATHPEEIRGTADEQRIIAARTAQSLLPLALDDNELVITHGNGPVVGKILMRQALSRDRIPPMSLDICVAHSQGGIAYLLMQALENALREADSARHVACLLTQVEVDPDDPAFAKPSKPIGPFFTKEQAANLTRE